MALVSATSFGVMISMARLTYEAGSNSLTVVFLRALVPSLLIAGIMVLRRQSFALQPGAFWPVAGVVLGQLGIALGYLSAVAFIPVSLAAMIFYAYPLVVALAVVLLGRSGIAWPKVLAFVTAFAGLGLALAPSYAVLNPWGLALAACATLSGALLFISAERLPAAQGFLSVGFYANAVAVLVAGLAIFALDAFALPQGAVGWTTLTAICLSFLVAFFSMIGAIRFAGALRAALIFNLEPLVAIFGAVVLLGERLDTTQTTGVILVLAALMAATLAERREKAAAAP
ncbi:DMT family transporter [Pelagibius litoralis]|uniref:DMT family transporter n=1 Tax=Pelagibius litoralis TaxID=374515 RepID=A0A967CC58_9PROT|nr:DMT family transporter [Pelagibius litoralis]NIA68759.1 DMT family transporter [Pelagibius litoralis]